MGVVVVIALRFVGVSWDIWSRTHGQGQGILEAVRHVVRATPRHGPTRLHRASRDARGEPRRVTPSPEARATVFRYWACVCGPQAVWDQGLV